MNMQSKILDRLRAIALAAGHDFVQDHDWSNTGVIRVQKKGTFETLVEVRYNFQISHCSLRIAIPQRHTLYQNSYLLYEDGPELERMVAAFSGGMSVRKNKRGKA